MASKVGLPMAGYETDLEDNTSLDIQKKPVNDTYSSNFELL